MTGEKQQRKVCSCGRLIFLDKQTAPSNDLGYWPTCVCGSTAFFPLSKILTLEQQVKLNKLRKKQAEEARKKDNDILKQKLRLTKK